MPPTEQGGFEPLDLSRRTPPSHGGVEDNEGISAGDGGVVFSVDGVRDSSTGVKLSQCLFCPFHTSSAELMAMHIQVNHTSKSRRKRVPSALLDNDRAQRATKPRMENADLDPLTVWRHVSEGETPVPAGRWSSARHQIPNGHREDTADDASDHQDSLASAPKNVRDGPAVEDKTEEKEEFDEDFEDNMESSSVEDLQDRDLRMSLDLSPALGSNHRAMDDDKILTG